MVSAKTLQGRVRREFNRIGTRYAQKVAGWPYRLAKDIAGTVPFPHAKVLDVACGPGTYSIPVSRRAARVVGLDLAEAMVRCAQRRSRQRPSSRLAFLQGDAGNLPFRSGEFDLCLCAFSFAHFPRPKRVVREMTRVLRSKGWLAIIDVVAPDRRQRDLLNRLELTRESCYTRIRDAREFVELFSGLPLQWRSWRIENRPISFGQWVAASHLKPGSAAFRRARKLFRETARQQRSGPLWQPRRPQYSYTVARLLLQKAS